VRAYPKSLRTGEHLSAGRLLFWGEQGIVDEIMFAGLVPEVLRIGSAITLGCDLRLQTLFARSFPEIEVVTAPAADADFAAHPPTGSLPRLLGTSESASVHTTKPYRKPDPIARDRFRSRYSDGRRLVGLA
jgi:hypothetical protein